MKDDPGAEWEARCKALLALSATRPPAGAWGRLMGLHLTLADDGDFWEECGRVLAGTPGPQEGRDGR
jgi:hypothetical protein